MKLPWHPSRATSFWLYAAVTLLSWSVAWLLGGEVKDGDSTISLSWQGAAIDFGLLTMLWRRKIWAWHGLMVLALSVLVVAAITLAPGMVPFALIAVLQLALLWSMRTAPEPRTRATA